MERGSDNMRSDSKIELDFLSDGENNNCNPNNESGCLGFLQRGLYILTITFTFSNKRK